MTIQINLFVGRVTLNFTTNRPSINTYDSAEGDGYEVYNQRHDQPSTPASLQTLVEGDHELIPHNTTDWISGVGDICHGTARGKLEDGALQMQRTERHTLSGCYRKREDSIKPYSSCPNSDTKRSALRRHCDFWDADQDGVIYPWDIFNGFRKLGFNIALCIWAAVTMSLCSSYSTQAGWFPSLLFSINLKNINCNRHGSTTGAYDLDAELDMQRFDAIFDKYADGKDYLTRGTVYDVWKGQCCANDFFGWFAGGLEWIAMYILLWPEDGRMRKDDIRGVYDGSIFWKIAEARSQGRSDTMGEAKPEKMSAH